MNFGHILSIVFLCILCLPNVENRRSRRSKPYEGYKVLRISIPDEHQPGLTKYFEDNYIDIWKHPSVVNPNYDVLVSPSTYHAVTKEVKRIGGSATVAIDNVEQLVEEQMASDREHRRKRGARTLHFNRYNTLETIHSWMQSFAARHSDIVELLHVGSSYEGRRILALKIGTKRHGKLAIWQDALVHGREWVTGASLVWIANEMVRQYRQRNADMINLVDNLDWFILPVWNVDGYKYTWRPKQRMWRKNRSRGYGYGCRGVDLNRNFKTPCRGRGTSSDYPCSEVYQGQGEFSEIETLTVSSYMETLRPRLAATISVHSYAQYWLYPYGFTASRSPDERALHLLSQSIVQSIATNNGTRYNYGTISRLAYPVSGGSVDWSYNFLCIKYSFGVEMRDTGNYGFMLPPHLIIPTAAEYFDGVKVLAKRIIQEGSVQRSAHCTHRYRHRRQNIRCHS